MPLSRTQLLLTGLALILVGAAWLVFGGSRALDGRPGTSRRFAGGVLVAVGLLCLLVSYFW